MKVILEHAGREISLDQSTVNSVDSAIGDEEDKWPVVPYCRSYKTVVTIEKGLMCSIWDFAWTDANDWRRHQDECIN